MPTAILTPGNANLPERLIVGDIVFRGGEGSVYFSVDRKYVVKIYRKPSPDKQRHLHQIIDLGRSLGADARFLAWPLGIVQQFDGNPAVGVVTRLVDNTTHAPLYKLIHSARDALQQFKQERSWLDYVKIARGSAAAVRAIHGKGMAHADIHPRNLLASLATGDVVLIDLDGLVVRGFLPPQVQGMPGFIAPEVVMGKAQPSHLSDRHSLAVLILWTLLFRNVMLSVRTHDPNDEANDDRLSYGEYACFSEHVQNRSNWLPEVGRPLYQRGALSYRTLTPKLQYLTEQALIAGLHQPEERPEALQWEQAIAEAYDLAIACHGCRQSFFYPYWMKPSGRRQCPFCGQSVRTPHPITIELMEERARGNFVSVRPVALYHGLPIFSDLIERGTLPPFSRKQAQTPIVGEVRWVDGVYRLYNTSQHIWQQLSDQVRPVGRNDYVVLQLNTRLSFGSEKRLLRVIDIG
ncbi:hypothetical protein EKD04_017120 [Chloroflexales bacterium ZM16-3]|nr:hypothetical protein [Chloroflexales bacterium ZM16-3]